MLSWTQNINPNQYAGKNASGQKIQPTPMTATIAANSPKPPPIQRGPEYSPTFIDHLRSIRLPVAVRVRARRRPAHSGSVVVCGYTR